MTQSYIITSDLGDEYKLRITSENKWMLSSNLFSQLNSNGIEIVDIELERSKGTNVTSHKVLSKIEECIAEFFLNHQNVLFCFFCDFISMVPSQKSHMSVQEYRSRLFSCMFDRYVSHHHLSDIYNNVVKINGVAETFYIHTIYRKKHQDFAELIAKQHLKDFGKPEQQRQQ